MWSKISKEPPTGNPKKNHIKFLRNDLQSRLPFTGSQEFVPCRPPADTFMNRCIARRTWSSGYWGSGCVMNTYIDMGHRALSLWEDDRVANRSSPWSVILFYDSNRHLHNGICETQPSQLSQHGYCWWSSAYMTPRHLQPAWRRPVGAFEKFSKAMSKL